ncbi:zinc-binding dehydrogenase [Streptomyces sp. NPDC008150]|uniref:NADP-dependent oxidoreductase n=1 Tax=Streptomyces sp. NPDC008150 TaxID=3364816 RepID=UPI0036EC5741
MGTMHAVRGHRRGGPEQLVYEEASRPVAGKGELLVRVRAASITAAELSWPATWTDSFDETGSPRVPVVPSKEFSGVVDAVGESVTGFDTGDEVYGLIPFLRDGAAAEFTVVPADVVAAKPAGLDHEHAAALPLAGLTAWQGLVEHGGLTAGQRVLVHGGAGGVGSIAVQVAAALGAEVIATSNGRAAEFVGELGAHRVIDYSTQRFEDEVADVDLVFDTVGGDTLSRSWKVLRPGGTLVSVASPPGERDGFKGVFFIVEPDREGLGELSGLVSRGLLDPRLDRVVPLRDTADAYRALEQGRRRGKIVIKVS